MDDAERIVLLISRADELTHTNILEYILSVLDPDTLQRVLRYVNAIV